MKSSKYEKYFEAGWWTKLRPFIESEEFDNIITELINVSKSGAIITPRFDVLFKAFFYCPYDKLKVVMLTNNSYESKMYGLAFLGEGKYDTAFAVVQDIQKDNDIVYQLMSWAKEGVLLLNADLTCIEGKPSAHLKIWRPFIEYIMKVLSELNSGIMYCLIGKEAQTFRPLINMRANDIIPLEHPMIAMMKQRPWKHCDMFNYINRISNLINNEKINW
jgi:uracil-DNA glycosylase